MKRYLLTVYDNEGKIYHNIILDTSFDDLKLLNRIFMEKNSEENIFTEIVYQKFKHKYHPNTFNSRAMVLIDYPITNIFEICF